MSIVIERFIYLFLMRMQYKGNKQEKKKKKRENKRIKEQGKTSLAMSTFPS
jgi:hypothetical protein